MIKNKVQIYCSRNGENMQEEEMCCCHKHKERSEKEYRDLINRLNRIEGQIRGI